MYLNDSSITTVESMINWMKQSKLAFALTGSRFFGGSKEDSDWDFFVSHSNSLVSDLKSLGFEPLDKSDAIHSYSDSSIAVVMEKTFDDGVIQIQLLQEGMFTFKFQAQKFLNSKYHDFKDFDKPTKKLLWSNTISMLSSMKGREVFENSQATYKSLMESFHQSY
jgi:hypothetical protein